MGVEPEVVDKIRQVASGVEKVNEVTELRVRWLGHRLYAELNIAVDSELSVKEGHDIALEVRHGLFQGLVYLLCSCACGSSRLVWGNLSSAEHELNSLSSHSH